MRWGCGDALAAAALDAVGAALDAAGAALDAVGADGALAVETRAGG
jgi:hypothetical protein